jgi:hypothetical protein
LSCEQLTHFANNDCDASLLAGNFPVVSLLDLHVEKFQLRGIDLPKKNFSGSIGENFLERFTFLILWKTNSNRRVGTCLAAPSSGMPRTSSFPKFANNTALSKTPAH